jgi:hypothetical protein
MMNYYGSTETGFGTRVIANLLERGWKVRDTDARGPCRLSKETNDPEEAQAEIDKARIESVRP